MIRIQLSDTQREELNQCARSPGITPRTRAIRALADLVSSDTPR